MSVRSVPDRFPIGVDAAGRQDVFLYLVRQASPLDLLVLVLRRRELLNALTFGTPRIVFPPWWRTLRHGFERATRARVAPARARTGPGAACATRRAGREFSNLCQHQSHQGGVRRTTSITRSKRKPMLRWNVER